jgi:hypothetical protein
MIDLVEIFGAFGLVGAGGVMTILSVAGIISTCLANCADSFSWWVFWTAIVGLVCAAIAFFFAHRLLNSSRNAIFFTIATVGVVSLLFLPWFCFGAQYLSEGWGCNTAVNVIGGLMFFLDIVPLAFGIIVICYFWVEFLNAMAKWRTSSSTTTSSDDAVV